METDEQLIKRILIGEKDIYHDLMLRYESKVYGVAYKVTNHPKDAEDITQEVFLQIYRSLAQFQGHSTFSTWIYKITMSKALDYKRKLARTPSYRSDEIPIYITTPDTPESLLMKKEEKELAQEFVDNLPPHYRDVVDLYYFHQLAYSEIADRLDIATKTVESRLYRAKQMMRKHRKEKSDEAHNR